MKKKNVKQNLHQVIGDGIPTPLVIVCQNITEH